MSSGRTNSISCGDYGTIEFIHTTRRPDDLASQLTYDADCRLWRASPSLALRDMRATHRDMSLINPEVSHEFV